MLFHIYPDSGIANTLAELSQYIPTLQVTRLRDFFHYEDLHYVRDIRNVLHNEFLCAILCDKLEHVRSNIRLYANIYVVCAILDLDWIDVNLFTDIRRFLDDQGDMQQVENLGITTVMQFDMLLHSNIIPNLQLNFISIGFALRIENAIVEARDMMMATDALDKLSRSSSYRSSEKEEDEEPRLELEFEQQDDHMSDQEVEHGVEVDQEAKIEGATDIQDFYRKCKIDSNIMQLVGGKMRCQVCKELYSPNVYNIKVHLKSAKHYRNWTGKH